MKEMQARLAIVLVLTTIISFPTLSSAVVIIGNSVAAAIASIPVTKSGSAFTPLNAPISPPVEARENSSDYRFANPLLFTETDKRFYTEYNGFNSQINSYIKSVINAHKADSISVYLRDMDSGHWTGINEDKVYEPSSLLKVAVMISYLRSATHAASVSSSTVDTELSKKLYYPGPDISGQNYPPQTLLATGTYPISELINDMIINSDNVALNVLMANNATEFQKVYKDFRLPPVPSGDPTDYMTARSYSVVFRTLYSSTYLPWDISDRALSLLSSTTFTQGLVAGVPPGTVVAHKFGEHTNIGQDKHVMWHELHDCGIVYYPGRPYLLCVMTSGQDFSKLEDVISDISNSAYQYIATMPPAAKN